MTRKKSLNYLLFIVVLVTLAAIFSSCKKTVVTDYPDTGVSYIPTEDDNETVSENENAKDGNDYLEDLTNDVSFNADPYDSMGNFIYNPIALRPGIEKYYDSDDIEIELAKQIMNTVDLGLNEMDVFLNRPIEKYEFDKAYKIAAMSNPIVYDADFETTDYLTYTISYPDFFGSLDEHDSIDPATFIYNDNNYPKELDEFKEFIKETIENTVSYDDTESEKAIKIYKYLIENFEIKDNDYLYEDTYIKPVEDGHIFIRYDVIRHTASESLYLYEFVKLYQFFLTQLNIKSIFVDISGECTVDRFNRLYPEEYFLQSVPALIIKTDGHYYFCNPYFEYLDYHFFAKEPKKCLCKYYGLSKDSFKKSFKIDIIAYCPDIETVMLDYDEPSVDYKHENYGESYTE